MAGQVVRRLIEEVVGPGFDEVLWLGEDERGIRVSTGVYLVILKSKEAIWTRKAVFVK